MLSSNGMTPPSIQLLHQIIDKSQMNEDLSPQEKGVLDSYFLYTNLEGIEEELEFIENLKLCNLFKFVI